jgi:hypothetical protein
MNLENMLPQETIMLMIMIRGTIMIRKPNATLLSVVRNE